MNIHMPGKIAATTPDLTVNGSGRKDSHKIKSI